MYTYISYTNFLPLLVSGGWLAVVFGRLEVLVPTSLPTPGRYFCSSPARGGAKQKQKDLRLL